MGKNKTKNRGKEYNIPDPKQSLEAAINRVSKYTTGKKGLPFDLIKSKKPVFAFDFMSENKSDLCFNSSRLGTADYFGFLKALKRISSMTYGEMRFQGYSTIRFHDIDFEDKRVTLTPEEFIDVLSPPASSNFTVDDLPTLYQFDLFYKYEARAVGFLYMGVFYVVWFDCHHLIYPQAAK